MSASAQGIMQLQDKLCRFASGENPSRTLAVKRAVLQFLNEAPWMRSTLHQCMTGLVSPDGNPMRKETGIWTNCQELAEATNIKCDGTHKHEIVEGSKTKSSEDLADRILHVIIMSLTCMSGPL